MYTDRRSATGPNQNGPSSSHSRPAVATCAERRVGRLARAPGIDRGDARSRAEAAKSRQRAATTSSVIDSTTSARRASRSRRRDVANPATRQRHSTRRFTDLSVHHRRSSPSIITTFRAAFTAPPGRRSATRRSSASAVRNASLAARLAAVPEDGFLDRSGPAVVEQEPCAVDVLDEADAPQRRRAPLVARRLEVGAAVGRARSPMSCSNRSVYGWIVLVAPARRCRCIAGR